MLHSYILLQRLSLFFPVMIRAISFFGSHRFAVPQILINYSSFRWSMHGTKKCDASDFRPFISHLCTSLISQFKFRFFQTGLLLYAYAQTRTFFFTLSYALNNIGHLQWLMTCICMRISKKLCVQPN